MHLDMFTSAAFTGDAVTAQTLVGSPSLCTAGLDATLSPAICHTATSPPLQPATAAVPSLQRIGRRHLQPGLKPDSQ